MDSHTFLILRHLCDILGLSVFELIDFFSLYIYIYICKTSRFLLQDIYIYIYVQQNKDESSIGVVQKMKKKICSIQNLRFNILPYKGKNKAYYRGNTRQVSLSTVHCLLYSEQQPVYCTVYSSLYQSSMCQDKYP